MRLQIFEIVTCWDLFPFNAWVHNYKLSAKKILIGGQSLCHGFQLRNMPELSNE